jgi:hypothetical protein
MLGSFSSSSSVIVSSSFDKIIADELPNANVRITSDEFGLTMNINIEIEQNSNIFMARVDFFYKNLKIDFLKVDESILAFLINEYQLYVTKLAKEKKQIPSTETWNRKSISHTIKNIRRVRKIAQHLFQDLRSINVYTIHGLKGSVVARTTIELDADIITIMQPELIGISTKNSLLNLHSINVVLANYMFMYRISKFFSIIKTMTNMTRITSMLLWIMSTAIPFYSSQQSVLSASLNNLNLFYTVLYPLLNFIGIPALLFKFIPKVIGFIIRSRILQNLQMQ